MKNLKFLDQLEQVFDKVKFGPLEMNLKLHDSKVVGATGRGSSTFHYKKNGKEESIKTFAQILHEACSQEKSGDFTFSFSLKKGKIERLVANSEIYIALT